MYSLCQSYVEDGCRNRKVDEFIVMSLFLVQVIEDLTVVQAISDTNVVFIVMLEIA